jgi:hypothetical protein
MSFRIPETQYQVLGLFEQEKVQTLVQFKKSDSFFVPFPTPMTAQPQ